jgi:hypothetical protein
MPVQRLGRNDKAFQETMGRGGSTFSIIRPKQKDSPIPPPESDSQSSQADDPEMAKHRQDQTITDITEVSPHGHDNH